MKMRVCVCVLCMHIILMGVNLMTANRKWLSTKQWGEQTQLLRHRYCILYCIAFICLFLFCFLVCFDVKKTWQIMWIWKLTKSNTNTQYTHIEGEKDSTKLILAWNLVTSIFSHHLDNDSVYNYILSSRSSWEMFCYLHFCICMIFYFLIAFKTE